MQILSVICCCMGQSSIPQSFTVTCYELLKHKHPSPGTIYTKTKLEPVIFARTTASTHLSFCQHSTSQYPVLNTLEGAVVLQLPNQVQIFSRNASAAVKGMSQFKPDPSQEQKPEVFSILSKTTGRASLCTTINICSVPPAGRREPGKQDLILAYITEGAAVLTVQ